MKRERVIPLIVAAALFMENMDSTVIATSLPAIAADIGTSPLTLKLAITSYLLSLAVFIPASGWMADRFGARNVFTAAIVVFMCGSIGCALSTSLIHFVIARVIEGIGGAMMTPVGRLVLLRSVEKRNLVAAMAYVAIPAQIGPIMGPALGGFITTYWSWHWIFLINIPIGIAGIVLAQRFIEPIKSPNPDPFDLRGFILSGIGLAGLAFGLSVAGIRILPWSVIIATIAVGAVSMTLYVMHARRVTRPVLDFAMLQITTLRLTLMGGFLFRLAAGASPFLLPLLLQVGFGMTPFQSGTITFVSALGALGMKTLTTKILGSFGFRNVMVVTAILAAITLAIPGFFTAQTAMALIMGVLLMGGFFRSLQFTAINTLVYADVDNARMSRATTLVSVLLQLATCAGVAVGAFSVEMTLLANNTHDIQAQHFLPAFIVIGVISASSVIFFLMLPANAGHLVSGHRGKAIEPSDAPPETEAVVLTIANDAEARNRQKAS